MQTSTVHDKLKPKLSEAAGIHTYIDTYMHTYIYIPTHTIYVYTFTLMMSVICRLPAALIVSSTTTESSLQIFRIHDKKKSL